MVRKHSILWFKGHTTELVFRILGAIGAVDGGGLGVPLWNQWLSISFHASMSIFKGDQSSIDN